MKKMSKKSLVMINQSGSYMDVDVANVAISIYDEVVILGRVRTMERELDERVTTIPMIPFDKSSAWSRMITWGWFSLQVFWELLTKYRGCDILYYTNPPMVCWSSLVLSNRFCIMEYDIYPDALKIVGIGSNHPISSLWRLVNKRLFAKAAQIYTLSEGMKSCLAKYGNVDKIKVIPLWTASSHFRSISKQENPFLEKLGLQDKFIVLYSGNIGYTHSVEVLVDIAKEMRNEEDIHFLIIGEGKKKAEIADKVLNLKLSNVTIMSYQPKEILPYSLGAADLGVITLDENVAQVSVPSKTMNLLAVGAPLLAISTEDTEMYRLLNKYNCGLCIPKQNVTDMVRYIKELHTNRAYRTFLSTNSIKASLDFTYKNAEMYFET